jgi:hypothetical protein
MGKKGKAQRKPKQGEQQAPRPGQDAFGEADERSASPGQSQRSDAMGETSERSAQPGRGQGQRAKRPGQKGANV